MTTTTPIHESGPPSQGAEWAITRRIKINATLSCDLTIGPGGACCEWVGGKPKFLTEVEKNRYRAGRNDLLAEVARKIGGGVMCVELA
jgi:hypothetical protein